MTEFKAGDRVEVRDSDHCEWKLRVFISYVELKCQYLVISEGGGYALSYAQCRHEVVDDAEMTRRAKIAELEQELAQLKNQ